MRYDAGRMQLTRRSLLAGALAAPAIHAARRGDILDRYQAGINLGTWISQYQGQKPPLWDTRVVEDDIRLIASWGMDHVRLPVDYEFFDDTQGGFREERLAYIDRALDWAKRAKLNVILDLHQAPGYFFGNVGKNRLFTDPDTQTRFLAVWAMFAKRYRKKGDHLLFELLNEVVEPPPAEWNALAARAIAAIRDVDKKRWIVVGGTHYNSVRSLADIQIFDDPRMVYTFHFYEPHLFTHQKASWSPAAMQYGRSVEYPGEFTGLAEFVEKHGHRGNLKYANRPFDRKVLEEDFQPAVDWRKQHPDLPLYCGEYGVIRFASEQSKINWYRDLTELLFANRIARAAWSYKDGVFGFVDAKTRQPLSEETIRIASRKWTS